MKTTAPTKQIPAAECVRNLAAIHGHITPQIVLDEARIKTSPLHSYFEWNNSAAAEKFRLVQAAALIRRIKVTIEAQPERTINVRAFVNVDKSMTDNDEDESELVASSVYVTVQEALTSTNYRAQLLNDCNRDIAAFRSKYAALEEAAGILAAMNQFSTTTNQ